MSVLAYLAGRIKLSWCGPILLTTSDNKEDDSLVDLAEDLGIRCFRGERNNLISRLWNAGNAVSCEHFVRVMGSYPLTDLNCMAILEKEHLEKGADYSYNEYDAGVPWGMGCEIVKMSVLEHLMRLNLNDEQKEVGTLYIRQNSDKFIIHRAKFNISRSHYKFALETEKDLLLLRDIVSHVPDPKVSSVVSYLDDHPILALSNHEQPSKEVGLEKLGLHPKKMKALNEAFTGSIDEIYPVSIELSLTNQCNLHCAWCSDQRLRQRQGLESVLPKEALFRLFDDLKEGGTRGVVIEGGGEPTIYRDFDEIVKYLSDIGMPCGLITNGTNQLSQDILSKFEWIRVSLDASNHEDFITFKGSDKYDDVLSNIHHYAQYCPTVGVGYIVTNKNMGEIETLVLRLRQYGISYIHFRPVIDCQDMSPKEIDLTYLARYQTVMFSIITEAMAENVCGGNSDLPCWAHSLSSVISADGSVYLCGRLNIHEWLYPIGNIRHQSFKEIWKGPERMRHITEVSSANFCRKHCPPCRMTKFNKFIKRIQDVKTPNFI